MRIKVQRVGRNDPDGIIVELITASGPVRVVLDHRQVEQDTVAVGYPLKRDNQLVFVVLPRPTVTGSYRVWVRAEDVLPNAAFAPAREPDRAVAEDAPAYRAAADLLLKGGAAVS